MKISVVTTLYHSEPFVREFYRRMADEVKLISTDYEIIFVNDGSPDRSGEMVLELQQSDANVVLIELSRNFGHQKALITGLKHAKGDFIFMIDSDLEEEPELLGQYWKEINADPDTDVVYGIQEKRKGNWFERNSGSLYYKLFSMLSTQKYPANSLTARLMRKQYVRSLDLFNEKESDLWGVFILAGFRQKEIPVRKGFKGRTTYTFRRKLAIAIATITTLTHRPLYLVAMAGLIITLLSLLFTVIMVIDHIIQGDADKWWITLVSIWFIGGLVLFAIGIVGVYIGKMFLEIKNRPFSIIKKIHRAKTNDYETD